MDGVLVVDKPSGPTSHDVVAAARRALGETRMGHTGTLDPIATGVLPLAIGRATRLVRFLAASDKDYLATVRFGLTTDSYDVTGTRTGGNGAVPAREAITEALAGLTGEYLQVPPPFSAKKVSGERAYARARRDQPVALAPVPVRVGRAEVLAFEDGRARIALTCSAGFYVRSFAHALGQTTGVGACLEALQRTRSGRFRLSDAIALGMLGDAGAVATRLVRLGDLLPEVPAVTLTGDGRARVSHGRTLGPDQYTGTPPDVPWVRLLDAGGELIALATRVPPGSLHPSIVLI